jgi:hypothetical protein
MKNLLTLVIAAGISLASTAQTATFLEHYTLDDINGIIESFDIPAVLLQPRFEVDVYRVSYETTHPNGEPWPVTGALAIPTGLTCELPLSSYQHGTIARKTDAPSYLSTETLLGVISATVGIVCSMPDYIGLGDSPGMHPYVHADSEALTSIDMLRAVRTLSDELNFQLNDQLFLWGYSQGGHATMAMHKMIEAQFSDEFTVTASAPMSGPYDISGVQANVLTSSEPYPTPGYLPYVVLSYQLVYGNLYESLDEVFLPQYAAVIPDLFDGTNSMGFINNQFPSVPSQMLLPEVLEEYENDPEHPIRLALQDNDLYDWTPQAPVRIYYCEGDDQVSYLNSIVALDAMEANNAPDVLGFAGGDLDHGACAPFALLGGFVVFSTLAEFNYTVNVSTEVVINAIDGGSAGDVTVTLTGDPGATVTWFDGTTGNSITGLNPGEYTFTVTASSGCEREYTVAVDGFVGLPEPYVTALTLYPNPANQYVTLGEHDYEQAFLFGLTGRMVDAIDIRQRTQLDLSQYAPGMYLLKVDGLPAIRLVIQR